MNTQLEFLQSMFPGRAALGHDDTCRLIGLAPGSGRNQLHQNRFPIPPRRIGAKIVFPLLDIANFLAGEQSQQELPKPVGKRRGRPRKAAPVLAAGGAK